MRQIHLPAARLWVGLGSHGVHVLRQDREHVVPIAAVSVLLGPGEPLPRILVHAADGMLWDLTDLPRRRYLEDVIACDADPALLVAARAGPVLHLESPRSCTTVALPDEPRIVGAAGARQATPHLALVVLQDSAWLVCWAEAEQEVRMRRLVVGTVTDALLLGGSRVLVLVRVASGPHDRLLVWQVAAAGGTGALELRPLPALLVARDVPMAARNPGSGPVLLAGQATWMSYRTGAWTEAKGPSPEGALTTRVYAGVPAVEPLLWQGQKQHPP